MLKGCGQKRFPRVPPSDFHLSFFFVADDTSTLAMTRGYDPYPLVSFQELLNYATHCLPLLSPKPTTYHPSNLTSTNLMLSLYPLNLSPFSKFLLCRGIVMGPKALPRHYILNKVTSLLPLGSQS